MRRLVGRAACIAVGSIALLSACGMRKLPEAHAPSAVEQKPVEKKAVVVRRRVVETNWQGSVIDVRVSLATLACDNFTVNCEEVSRDPLPNAAVYVDFEKGGRIPPTKPIMEGDPEAFAMTGTMGVAQIAVKDLPFPAKSCATKTQKVFVSSVITPENRAIRCTACTDPVSMIAVDAEQVATCQAFVAKDNSLTVEDARAYFRTNAQSSADEKSEEYRKKFCSDSHPDTMDGEVCYIIGASWSQKAIADVRYQQAYRANARSYLKFACSKKFSGACEHPELIEAKAEARSAAITGHRQSSELTKQRAEACKRRCYGSEGNDTCTPKCGGNAGCLRKCISRLNACHGACEESVCVLGFDSVECKTLQAERWKGAQ